ncbi:SAM-dependent methyltransferase [Saccharothrix algeriensis]|uniref:S-adenosyl-L-methionine-dependent methyltransferase n=1 Tax=Catellatospora bangladeshensis TaxID=310355 RepID=A0A8J3NGL6_9ACTN|nr:S-adenosyl-L-methionine-dependent methyltransferase [Catellatospora bangladeshensis]
MVSAVPEGVGRTALGAAMVRAMESRRRDRLFDDPYAAAFLAAARDVFGRESQGAAAFVGGVSGRAAGFWNQAVVRTRFFDDYLLAAAMAGVRQVVVLGAGLDTRAYRLAWPAGVRLFEVDTADVLDFKRDVLRRRGAATQCGHAAVAADLRGDWAIPLLAAGMRPAEPTAWLLEGLLIYLSAAEAAHLLAVLHEHSAPGSRASFEAGGQVPRPAGLPVIAQYTALWKGGLDDAPGGLARHGWQITTHDAAELAAGYGRSQGSGGFVVGTLPG